MQHPPNILLITSDQQRADAIGLVNPAIRTPNLDRLAQRGTLFDRGYTVNPVCTPSRVSMLTGQYPSRHGCYHVGTAIPEAYAPNVATLLGETGYFTGLLGKAHFRPCLDPNSFEAEPNVHNREVFRNWRGPYHGFQHVRLTIGHTCESHACGMHYGAWLDAQGVDIPAHFGNRDYHSYGEWELPETFHGSRWIADEVIAALDSAGERDKPFFLWASFQDPHNPYVVPEPWASMYRPGDLPDYHLREGEMLDKPSFYRTLADCMQPGDKADEEAKSWSDVRSLPLPPGEPQRILAAYYGMVSLMDHHIGRILDALEAKGLMENTIIVFTSDHGDQLGNHGLWGKGMPAYEDVQRVPFIVCHPECRTPGTRSVALQSVVDLPQTFLTAAGLDTPPGMQGVDQTESWTNSNATVRNWAMAEFKPDPDGFSQRTFIEPRYKLVLYRGIPDGELYDLQEDSEQIRNLWDDPESRATRDELIQRFALVEPDTEVFMRERTAYA